MANKLTDREIEELYDSGRYRLAQERNDFLLPQILDFVNGKNWINLHPEYQRRLVWDAKKKSRLIESLLMNIPIPPVFLFEYDLNRYEVMDGQQRLSTIVEFYENRLTLRGLETWNALNGRTYADCPPRICRGLDRRRVSATILLVESGRDEAEDNDVRRIVFERLNTGGQNLNPQELRNCLYSGPFNDLLTDLAGDRLFNELWEIPPYEDNIRSGRVNAGLRENKLYKRMGDCELVLRFFAFRRRSKLKGSVRSILDACMRDLKNATEDEIAELRKAFLSRLSLAREIFGDETFRTKPESDWRLSKPLYDAVMVALDRLGDRGVLLVKRRARISAAVMKLLQNAEEYEVIVGRPNTAAAIKERQDKIEAVFRENL